MQLDSKDPTEKAEAERFVLIQSVADAIIFNWRTKGKDGTVSTTINIGGTETTYSREAVVGLMAHQSFRAAVITLANEDEHFRLLDEEQGNASGS